MRVGSGFGSEVALEDPHLIGLAQQLLAYSSSSSSPSSSPFGILVIIIQNISNASSSSNTGITSNTISSGNTGNTGSLSVRLVHLFVIFEFLNQECISRSRLMTNKCQKNAKSTSLTKIPQSFLLLSSKSPPASSYAHFIIP